MYTWTYVNEELDLVWIYVFDTNSSSKVAKHIRKNVKFFWENFFSKCVDFAEKLVDDDEVWYCEEGPIFTYLEEYIRSKKKLSKKKYIKKIEEILSEMTTDEIIASMNFSEDQWTGKYRLELEDNDVITFE